MLVQRSANKRPRHGQGDEAQKDSSDDEQYHARRWAANALACLQVASRRLPGAALHKAETVCRWLLPRGQKVGREDLALNPKRHDGSIGSLKVNLTSGPRADFGPGDGEVGR
jgi:hypothetical protein